jgi:tryptophanyl-tRNA synthetase
MSKSYSNVIGLFDSPELTKKKVMSIVTDSAGPTDPKDPETCNIFAFHKLFSGEQLPELKKRYQKGGITYKESKDILLENILAFQAPIQKRKAELEGNPEYVDQLLEEGRQRASVIAETTLNLVKERVGL